MKRQLSFVAALAFGPLLLAASPAYAGIADCGNIHVEANAMCELDVSGGCEAKCTPVSLQAACSVEIQGGCTGKCTADVDASCTASCSVSDCEAECNVKPASFDCSANCYAEGSGMCDAQCQAADNHGECVASCQASFSARCDASCKGTPAQADCSAKCTASCEGQCKAKANVGCDIQCVPPTAYADCEAMLQGGCEASCSAPDGALFCNGQYVDYGDHLAKCEAALAALVHAEVHGSASSGCDSTNGCHAEAEGSAKASCALAALPAGDSGSSWILAGLGLTAVAARRRRRSVV